MKKVSSDEYYSNFYGRIFNSGVIGLLSRFMHLYIERPYSNSTHQVILEVGSGQGQHFPYVKEKFVRYVEYDLRNSEIPSDSNSPLFKMRGNAESLDQIESNSIDRLIATCLLVHLQNVDDALKEWRRVVRNGGILDIYVPCEPGMLLRLFRLMTTVPKARKLGVDQKSIHYREHRNMWIFCNIAIKECFGSDDISVSKFPPIPYFWNFRLFDVYRIKVSK